MNHEQDGLIELIDAYLDGKMTHAEHAEFQHSVRNDPSLCNQVKLARVERAVIGWLHEDRLREQMWQIDRVVGYWHQFVWCCTGQGSAKRWLVYHWPIQLWLWLEIQTEFWAYFRHLPLLRQLLPIPQYL